MFGKPCLACGDAFYNQRGLAISVTSPDELLELAQSDLSVSESKVTRFVAYLRDEFYSFGVSYYELGKAKEGNTINRVNRIDFSRITQLTPEPIVLGKQPSRLPEDSFLLSVVGYKKGQKPVGEVAEPSRAPVSLPPSNKSTTAKPEWSIARRAVHNIARVVLAPALVPEDRRRMRDNPIDFFKKAKWPPNRFFGRLLLDKSQRPY